MEAKVLPTKQSNLFPPAPAAINRLIQDVIQDQVVENPNSPAICAWDGYYTYGELDQLSSRLASQLSEYQVGPDVIVPILCDKSAIGIICMLAVCKAGGAFAALDVSHPDERLEEILSDTKATLLLASSGQSNRFLKITNLTTLEVSNALLSSISPIQGSLAPHKNASPNNIMYVIFTSGSTGRPKGVMIEHRAFVTSVLAFGPDQGINKKSRVMQFSSYAFDMSLMEIFTTLVLGGCICVPTDEERFGGIPEFVNKTGVNTAMLTPSYAKLLDPSSMPSLQKLIAGGEAVSSDLLETWLPYVDVYIAYGPTEAAIHAAGIEISSSTKSTALVTGLIGRPTGCNLWIVKEDNHHELVSGSETGELLIEGHTLARGYLGDEAKTKDAFVDFMAGPDIRRAYKTGDLVRRSEDGAIVFMGRKDTQVKIQGIRFETAEIETRLSESQVFPAGSRFCVDKVELSSSAGQSTLIAFISDSVKVSGSELPQICWDQVEDVVLKIPHIRDSLGKVLPAPLIPPLYIPITFVPLASSAKTDRRTLQQLAKGLSPSAIQRLQKLSNTQADSKILTSSEDTLCQLWALVLSREPKSIGPDDNFIHLGGDSVTSIKLVSAARDRGVCLTSSMILSNPILSEQAKQIHVNGISSEQTKIEPFALVGESAQKVRATAAAICKLQAEDLEDVLPMTMNQMRWYGKTLVKPDAMVDQHHFQLPIDVDLDLFVSALNSTVEAAELLRARVVPDPDKKLLQAIVKFRPVELTMANDTLDAYLNRDLEVPMGFGCPLSRYAILSKIDSVEKVFVWTIHHAIYDGYSISMLLHTMDEFYRGLKPAPLTPFNRYLKGPSEQQLADGQRFWTAHLTGSSWSKFPALPPAEKRVAPSMGTTCVTTANLIRVAYAAALSPYSQDATDVLFLESLGGRNSTLSGIERIAGPTFVTCATRLRFPASKPCREVLVEAQKSLIARMRFEDYPLVRLLPLLPALELRSVLLIEDTEFLLTGAGDILFKNANSELNLEESDALPMLFRCNMREHEIEVDVRYDTNVVGEEGMDSFVTRFERFFVELSGGDNGRSFSEIQAQ